MEMFLDKEILKEKYEKTINYGTYSVVDRKIELMRTAFKSIWEGISYLLREKAFCTVEMRFREITTVVKRRSGVSTRLLQEACFHS